LACTGARRAAPPRARPADPARSGFWANLAGIVVYRGLYFGSYDTAKEALPAALRDSFAAKFAVAWGCTTGAALASYPLDTVRRRMMMTSGGAVHYRGFVHAGREIVAKEGAKALFGACHFRSARVRPTHARGQRARARTCCAASRARWSCPSTTSACARGHAGGAELTLAPQVPRACVRQGLRGRLWLMRRATACSRESPAEVMALINLVSHETCCL
jgi:hypothetical protein